MEQTTREGDDFPSLEGFQIKNRAFSGSYALAKYKFTIKDLRNCELVQPFAFGMKLLGAAGTVNIERSPRPNS